MAFKSKKIVGNGTALAVLTNTNIVEAVVHSLIAYNSTGGALTFTVYLDAVPHLVEPVPAYGVFRLTDKLNVEPSVVVTLNAPTGVEVVLNYLSQAIDIAAATTATQQYILDGATQAALATTNGAAQVTLAEAEVVLATNQTTAAQDRVVLAQAEVVKCQDQVALAKAALPVGTIDDALIDTTKAWSSDRINTEINDLKYGVSPIVTSMMFK
jgi:hypothetical protein